MDPFENFLTATLADYRLSRGEKRALGEVLREMNLDNHQLAVVRHRVFEIAREHLKSPEDLPVVQWLEDVVKLMLPQETEDEDPKSTAFFSPKENCVGEIVRLLARTRHRADICVFTITDDRISKAILEAHRRRVDVRVITDNDKAEDLGSDVDDLEAQGVPVRVDQTRFHMHHKFALFDRKRVLTGSYNWTRSAAMNNEENFVVSSDPELIARFETTFEELWSQFE